MIILQKSLEGIIIGRNPESPIGCFMFNSWNGTLNTVAIDKYATDDETELLRKIAYRYSEKIWKSTSGMRVHPERLNIFQESFDEYHAKPEKELADIAKTGTVSGGFKNRYHFFVIQVPKNLNPEDDNTPQYIVTSANNDGDNQLSWNQILEINPKLMLI